MPPPTKRPTSSRKTKPRKAKKPKTTKKTTAPTTTGGTSESTARSWTAADLDEFLAQPHIKAQPKNREEQRFSFSDKGEYLFPLAGSPFKQNDITEWAKNQGIEPASVSTFQRHRQAAISARKMSQVGGAGAHSYVVVDSDHPSFKPGAAVYDTSAKNADKAVKQAVKAAGGIVPYMKALAQGDKSQVEAQMNWGHQATKDWLKNQFRDADPGKHEWLPCAAMAEVIKKACDSADAAIEAAEWIDFQHEFRTPTTALIFDPGGPSPATAVEPEEFDDEGNPLMQINGHSGAIYRGKKPCTVGQGAFHGALESSFSPETTIASVKQTAANVFKNYVWDGNGTVANLDPQVRNAAGETGIDAISATQKTAYAEVKKPFKGLI